MKLKLLLPWICVLGLGVGLASVFVSSRAKDTELTKLRETATQLQSVSAELEESRSQAAKLTEQNTDLRKDTQDLLRLRSEVGQLRTEKQQLFKQVQAVQSQAQQAQTQAEQAMKSNAAKAMENATLKTEIELRQRAAQPNPARDACINNLRLMDAAKQQWAVDYSKSSLSVPTVQEIAPYLSGGLLPVCQAGGTYGINALNAVPSCSILGHAMK